VTDELQATNDVDTQTPNARVTESAVFPHIDWDYLVDSPLMLVGVLIHHSAERHVTDHIVCPSMERVGIVGIDVDVEDKGMSLDIICSREAPRFLR